jgi:glucose-1-phosphate cytidylyltransferase
VDLEALLKFHRSHGRLATVTGVRPPGRFGELELSADGGIRSFNEKPQVSEGHINGGFMVFKHEFVERYLSGRDDEVLEREPLMRLAKDGQLMMFEHNGFWQPMDTLREYQLLNDLWAGGKAPWKLWQD